MRLSTAPTVSVHPLTAAVAVDEGTFCPKRNVAAKTNVDPTRTKHKAKIVTMEMNRFPWRTASV